MNNCDYTNQSPGPDCDIPHSPHMDYDEDLEYFDPGSLDKHEQREGELEAKLHDYVATLCALSQPKLPPTSGSDKDGSGNPSDDSSTSCIECINVT